jgi:hypothetical protein
MAQDFVHDLVVRDAWLLLGLGHQLRQWSVFLTVNLLLQHFSELHGLFLICFISANGRVQLTMAIEFNG